MNLIKNRLVKIAREENISIWKDNIDEVVIKFEPKLTEWKYEEDDKLKIKLGDNHFRVDYGVYLHKNDLDSLLKDLFPIDQASKLETKNKLIDDIYNNYILLEEKLKQFYFSDTELRKTVKKVTDAKPVGLAKNIEYSNEKWKKITDKGILYSLTIEFDIKLQ